MLIQSSIQTNQGTEPEYPFAASSDSVKLSTGIIIHSGEMPSAGLGLARVRPRSLFAMVSSVWLSMMRFSGQKPEPSPLTGQ